MVCAPACCLSPRVNLSQKCFSIISSLYSSITDDRLGMEPTLTGSKAAHLLLDGEGFRGGLLEQVRHIEARL